jgi:hypothetical protein
MEKKSSEVKCYLIMNDLNGKIDQAISRTVKLEVLTYKEFLNAIWSAFEENFMDVDKIKTYLRNGDEFFIFDNNEQLKKVIKENLPVYVQKVSLDMPELFYI